MVMCGCDEIIYLILEVCVDAGVCLSACLFNVLLDVPCAGGHVVKINDLV